MTITLTETTHVPTCPLCQGELLLLDNVLVDSVVLGADDAYGHGVATATSRCTACEIDFA